MADGGKKAGQGRHLEDDLPIGVARFEEAVRCGRLFESFTKRLDILKIVPVDVRGEVRLKEHSRSEVYLADEMRVHMDIIRYLDEGGEL